MEAPKEIYTTTLHYGWYPTNEGGDKIKYIRADLAELTWEDIGAIIEIWLRLQRESYWREQDRESVSKEILRRFKELVK